MKILKTGLILENPSLHRPLCANGDYLLFSTNLETLGAFEIFICESTSLKFWANRFRFIGGSFRIYFDTIPGFIGGLFKIYLDTYSWVYWWFI